MTIVYCCISKPNKIKGVQVNIKDLQLLQVLLECQSITRAADIMHIAQPAVTVKLGKLRDHFKDELLVRKGNKMILTQKAQTLLESLVKVNNELNNLVYSSKEFNPSEPHSFTIIIHEFAVDLIAKHLVAKLLSYNKSHNICIETISNFYDDIQIKDLSDADITKNSPFF